MGARGRKTFMTFMIVMFVGAYDNLWGLMMGTGGKSS